MGKKSLLGMVGLFSLAVVVYTAGCGKKTFGPAEGDAKDIYLVVAGVQGAATDDDLWAEVWATGSEPDKPEREKYGKVQPLMDEDSLAVEGDSATFGVAIYDARSNLLEETEWTAVKEGGKWKIKPTPLPAVPK